MKLVIMAESDFDNFITKIDEIYTLNRLSNVLQLQAGQCTDNWSFGRAHTDIRIVSNTYFENDEIYFQKGPESILLARRF